MNKYAKDIIKKLERVTSSGNRQSVIFEDWLELVHVSLTMLPEHLRSAISDRTLAKDTPETEKLFERLRARYTKDYYWKAFSEALYILMESTNGESEVIAWDDTIGQVYMEWGMPNKHSGQFFTPFSVAQVMANVSMGNIEEELFERLESAYLQTPTGAMHKVMFPERVPAFVRKMGADLIPLCVEHLKPIVVNDCCCGSGVMFLAAAQITPRWALDWGLVQFSGMDIDQTCVMMCQVNMMLYGLNGYNLRCAVELSKAELQSIPEPWQSAYQEAIDNPDRAGEISVDVRSWQQESLL